MTTPQDIIERITSAAQYRECIVIVKRTSLANLRWASSTLTTNGVITEQQITVIAFVDLPGGVATGSLTLTDIGTASYDELAAAAGRVAEAAGPAEDVADILRDVQRGDWSATHEPTSPDVFADFAPALGDMFRRSTSDAIELFGYAEHSHTTTWVGSKGGLRLRHDQPSGRVEMTGKSHNRSRSTWEGRATRDFSDVSVSDIDANIRQRLEWQSRVSAVAPGRYQTVAPSGAVADLMAYILYTAPARDAFEGRSVFSKPGQTGATRVGEQLSALPFNLYCDPHYAGLESIDFNVATQSGDFGSVFDNGRAIDRFNLLRAGRLEHLITSQATSAVTGLPFAPAGDNLILDLPGGTGGLNDVIGTVQSGLLLTTLWYIRVVDAPTFLLTGLTRDGIYEIKDGEVVGAVNNFRWNESPVDLLRRMSGAGATEITATRELEQFTRTAAPAVVFDDFNMSTVSQAN